MFQGLQRSHLGFQSFVSEILPSRVIELLTTPLNVLYTEVKRGESSAILTVDVEGENFASRRQGLIITTLRDSHASSHHTPHGSRDHSVIT
jgi:hypothetical protein